MKKEILIISFVVLLALISIAIFYFLNSKKPIVNPLAVPKTSPSPVTSPVAKFEVPVLMYHYIRDASGESQLGQNLSVSPGNFDKQLQYLKDNNYQTLKLEALADPNRQEISKIYAQNKKPIVLTFDDGYEDAYTTAFPTLKKYHDIGTFFIIKDYTNKPEYMTSTQISEMANAGMEFGSHTLSHPDLTKISEADAHSQIFDSKNGYDIFCYPSGKFNDTTVSLVREAGYKVAVTTKIGIARETSNLFEIPRVRVENTDVQAFADKISYAQEHGI